jgi:DNA polymerase III delta subunit
MGAEKPSRRSPTKSSAAASKAGSAAPRAAAGAKRAAGEAKAPAAKRAAPARGAGRSRAGAPTEPLALLERADTGEFPASVYLEGPDEAVKAEFLAHWRRAWARAVPDAPQARVLRPDEHGVEAILAAWQNVSLFTPRELTIAFDIEDLGRSEKKVAALAQGLGFPGGASCLVLVESPADSARKTLEPLRAAVAVRVDAQPPAEGELIAWGRRRLAASGCQAESGALEALLETCEHDAVAYLTETGKLAVLAGAAGRVTKAHVERLTAPLVSAGLPDYLMAVAAGDANLAARQLERVLAAGEDEGSVMWSLGHLVSSTLSLASNPYGWAKYKLASAALGRRRRPGELVRALDAVYRAEAAWKGGRTDARTALELATREVAAR